MQVADIPDLGPEINDIRSRTARLVNDEIIPAEPLLAERDERALPEVRRLQALVKGEGLWAPHLPKEYGGMGIGFLKHAYMNEVMGWSPYSSTVFGVQAPNSGNTMILLKHGTEEQKKKWLEPLIRGEIESCFSMTEPDNPGSDPSQINTRAVRDGDEWVINGRKWFTSNAKRAAFAIVVCRTEDEGVGGRKERHTNIIVPTDTQGFKIVRSVPIFGIGGDHGENEIVYENVRVPITNALGQEGSGHQVSQDRLGAGRVFHCMSCVGHMWRAFDLMNQRAISRRVHGGMLEEKQLIQAFIADSFIDIQAARLMTINTARKIDEGQDVAVDISAIKVFVPEALTRVVDRAIQTWGAAGVTSDLPLEGMYKTARYLRIGDGPDEVHKILVAKHVLRRYHAGQSWDFGV
jgi:acyl-CoA dehydrogenase